MVVRPVACSSRVEPPPAVRVARRRPFLPEILLTLVMLVVVGALAFPGTVLAAGKGKRSKAPLDDLFFRRLTACGEAYGQAFDLLKSRYPSGEGNRMGAILDMHRQQLTGFRPTVFNYALLLLYYDMVYATVDDRRMAAFQRDGLTLRPGTGDLELRMVVNPVGTGLKRSFLYAVAESERQNAGAELTAGTWNDRRIFPKLALKLTLTAQFNHDDVLNAVRSGVDATFADLAAVDTHPAFAGTEAELRQQFAATKVPTDQIEIFRQLEGMAKPTSIPWFMDLGNRDMTFETNVLQVLATLPATPESRAFVRERLTASSEVLRLRAVEAAITMEATNPEERAAVVLSALRDSSPSVRSAGLDAAAKIPLKGHYDALAAVPFDPRVTSRRTYVLALAKAGGTEAVPRLRSEMEALMQQLQVLRDDARGPVLTEMQYVLEGLMAIDTPEVLVVLGDYFRAGTDRLQVLVAMTLGRSAQPAALTLVEELLPLANSPTVKNLLGISASQIRSKTGLRAQ